MLLPSRTRALLLPLLLLAGGCASTATEETIDAAPESTPPAEIDQDKVDDLTHKVVVAKAQLEVAHLEFAAFEMQQAISFSHSQEELTMAQNKLADFKRIKLPNRKLSAELSLQSATDFAAEAAEELKQLEIMYKDQDLHEMTAEYVMNRGQRRADRANKRIDIQKKDFDSLMGHELPLELQMLEIALSKAQENLEKAKSDGEIARRGKDIKNLDAEATVVRAERALAKEMEGDKE
ncbi:MAG: ABC-type Fe3+/spermidine/putrescine transport system ATPase subunit [Planctomycetota bacterium]|jgi:ABC-type Fe3+/spermidine/putrescine transport system ATPase subunit